MFAKLKRRTKTHGGLEMRTLGSNQISNEIIYCDDGKTIYKSTLFRLAITRDVVRLEMKLLLHRHVQ
jgi:hypothetical protein